RQPGGINDDDYNQPPDRPILVRETLANLLTRMADPNEQSEKLNAWAKEEGLLETPGNANGNGDRPLIKIPSDQRELIDFCRECAVELAKDDRLFRRDRTPVAINREKA